MKPLIIGRVGAPFGVKGFVHVHSFSEPEDNLIHFSEWFLKLQEEWKPFPVLEARAHGKNFVAHLKGCDDRDAAALLTHADIGVARQAFPILPKGEYYWADLIGLAVYTDTGKYFGIIDSLFETGSNDVMLVRDQKLEYLIPYILEDVILHVDLQTKKMTVCWDPDF